MKRKRQSKLVFKEVDTKSSKEKDEKKPLPAELIFEKVDVKSSKDEEKFLPAESATIQISSEEDEVLNADMLKALNKVQEMEDRGEYLMAEVGEQDNNDGMFIDDEEEVPEVTTARARTSNEEIPLKIATHSVEKEFENNDQDEDDHDLSTDKSDEGDQEENNHDRPTKKPDEKNKNKKPVEAEKTKVKIIVGAHEEDYNHDDSVVIKFDRECMECRQKKHFVKNVIGLERCYFYIGVSPTDSKKIWKVYYDEQDTCWRSMSKLIVAKKGVYGPRWHEKTLEKRQGLLTRKRVLVSTTYDVFWQSPLFHPGVYMQRDFFDIRNRHYLTYIQPGQEISNEAAEDFKRRANIPGHDSIDVVDPNDGSVEQIITVTMDDSSIPQGTIEVQVVPENDGQVYEITSMDPEAVRNDVIQEDQFPTIEQDESNHDGNELLVNDPGKNSAIKRVKITPLIV